ncbi:MAG: hypothetical protein HY978_03740 [Candidatus Liptonbacteria bacterium]|nr:hypothetical protein [Candidatus Liptonbacteria bacterium]
MNWQHTDRSENDYRRAPAEIRKAFNKQARPLSANLQHPSLRAKKYDEAQDLWQARVTRDWRFYFVIRGDLYIVVTIVRHPK